ncbi:MAG: hypothetical protein IJ764_07720 [Bacteroidales bacterium]|nr:hypothetical protein [Bacteroidales bacterium]
MKKTLKIFGLALLASTLMFTACSKDDEKDDKKDNTENNGGNNNNDRDQDEDDDSPSLILLFDNEPAQLGYYQAVIDDSINPYIFSFVAVGVDENNNYTLPQLQITLNYNSEADEDNKWSIPAFYYTDNAEHFAALRANAANGAIPPEWVAKDFNAFVFTKFETSPVVLSFEADATMQSNYEYRIENAPEASLTTKQMLMAAKNIKFVNGRLRQ